MLRPRRLTSWVLPRNARCRHTLCAVCAQVGQLGCAGCHLVAVATRVVQHPQAPAPRPPTQHRRSAAHPLAPPCPCRMARKKCRTKAPVELVQCPVCDGTMRMTTLLHIHFDTCLKRKQQQQRRQPGGHGGGASPEQQLAGPHPQQVQLQQQADEFASSEYAALYYEGSGVSAPGGHVGGRVGGTPSLLLHVVIVSRVPAGVILPSMHAFCLALPPAPRPTPTPPRPPSGLPAARPPGAAARRARRRRPATQAPADRGAFAPAGLASAPCNQ